jgi:hypothetical protein
VLQKNGEGSRRGNSEMYLAGVTEIAEPLKVGTQESTYSNNHTDLDILIN